MHFVHQLAYYVTFEVMECSWDILIKQLKHAENLDEVIEAHSEFLETLVKRALLDERSRDLLTQLRAIYDRILEFQSIQNKLYLAAVAETEARKSHESEVSARGARGTLRSDQSRGTKRPQATPRVCPWDFAQPRGPTENCQPELPRHGADVLTSAGLFARPVTPVSQCQARL